MSMTLAIYADSNYYLPASLAIGSFLNHHPDGRVILFYEGPAPEIHHSGVKKIQIQQEVSIPNGLHRAVLGKLRSRLYCLRELDEPWVLFCDSDVLFRSPLDGDLELFLASPGLVGACQDRIPTEYPTRNHWDPDHRSSVKGMLSARPDLIQQIVGENLREEPYFNSGVLLLKKDGRLAQVFQDVVDFILADPDRFTAIKSWPEQALLNLFCLKHQIPIYWLIPKVWNFDGPQNRITHLFCSGGNQLRGYSGYQSDCLEAWGALHDCPPPIQLYKVPPVSLPRTPFELPVETPGDKPDLFFEWRGEFGWEIIQAYPMVNYLRHSYNVTFRSINQTEGLYRDLGIRYLGPKETCNIREGILRVTFTGNDTYDPKSDSIHLAKTAREIRTDLPRSRENLICVHARFLQKPGSGLNWRNDYIPALRFLCSKGYQIYFIGHPSGSLSFSEFGEDYRGFDLDRTISLMKRSSFTFGPSSGPMHLSQWLKVPVFTWGAKDPRYIPGSREGAIWNPLSTQQFHPWSSKGEIPDCYHDINYRPSQTELIEGLDYALSLLS